jgi:hypothetical protein
MDFFKVITSPLALHISVDSTVAVMPSDETVVPPRLEVENALFR